MSTLAASSGLDFADAYVVGLAFVGLAVLAAIAALSHQTDRAYSASLIYLGVGAVAAAAIEIFSVRWLSPLADSEVFERTSELAVCIALFATGLKLDRPARPRAWGSPARLLGLAMPLTIAAVALFGSVAMGLSLGAAIALGAILAPTDPVLAGDVGVGPPGDEDRSEPRFAITGEAGLNDGLAFPFVWLAVVVAADGDEGTLFDWVLVDVAYKLVVGVAAGALVGYALAAVAVRLRDRRLLAPELDGWLAVGAVLLLYGMAEALSGYGFLAAFAGGLAFRRYEYAHEYNRRVHAGAETVEKFAELGIILLLGSSVTVAGLGEPGLVGWLLVPLLLVVIRPLAVAVSLVGSRMTGSERAFVGWFGVRGIGSLYYVAVVIGAGVLSEAEERTLFWTVVAVVVTSIVAHGVTAAPLSRRWLPEHAGSSGR